MELQMPIVFVSHRGEDGPAAEQLASDLRARGHEVWLDRWEIGLGDSIVGRMNEGLAGAAYLVLCYSAKGVEAPWISREWMSALARQLDGCRVKILPVLLSGGKPPAIMADVKYADLNADWPSGVNAISAAIK